MDYRTYIASTLWRNNPARLAELADAGGRCRTCFADATAGARLEVHHATYERRGCEVAGDLLAICSDCHLEVTSFLARRRYEGRTPRRADVVNIHDLRRPLFDPTR
jgi:hypothetical protein